MSSTIPLPPREQLYNRYCSNKHTHLCVHRHVSFPRTHWCTHAARNNHVAFSLRASLHTPSYNRPIHDCDDGTSPRAKTPVWTFRTQPCSSSTCCLRVRTVGAGELQQAQKQLPVLTLLEVLPVGQELEVGQFPLEPNTKSLNIHSGCHKTALLSCYVRPSGTHPALSVPARNGAGAKALPVLNVHELCSWCKSSKLDRSHCSGAACGRV